MLLPMLPRPALRVSLQMALWAEGGITACKIMTDYPSHSLGPLYLFRLLAIKKPSGKPEG